MRHRYDNWVEGLNGDWLVSRQRYWGVPFPIWYRLDAEGRPDYDDPIVPSEDSLPIDPSSHVPPGFTDDQRGKPNGFIGDPDIMDTWATSSLTPMIACGWEEDPDLFARTYPMDLRPQGHDIIRTWLFSTIVRSHFERDTVPWAHAALSGWILDPDRKKMSKSKGNVVTPIDLLHEHGSDAVRYWAASGRPGTDTAFDTGQMKVGRRLAIKVLNAAASPSASARRPPGAPITDPLDQAVLVELADLVDECTTAFEGYDYARALQRTEEFFWRFCDDYLELVKGRAYGEGAGAESARATLRLALSTLLRLFAPILPFATEEVWSWCQTDDGPLAGLHRRSIHNAPWPRPQRSETAAGDSDPLVLEVAADVLGKIRKAKSDAKRSMRGEVDSVVVHDTPDRIAALLIAVSDVRDAGKVADLTTMSVEEGTKPTVDVTLAAEA